MLKTKVVLLSKVNNFVKRQKIPTGLISAINGDPNFHFRDLSFGIFVPKEAPGMSGNIKNGFGMPKNPYFDISHVSLSTLGSKWWQKHFSRGFNPFFERFFQRLFQKFSKIFQKNFKDFFKIFQRLFQKCSKIFFQNLSKIFQKP